MLCIYLVLLLPLRTPYSDSSGIVDVEFIGVER